MKFTFRLFFAQRCFCNYNQYLKISSYSSISLNIWLHILGKIEADMWNLFIFICNFKAVIYLAFFFFLDRISLCNSGCPGTNWLYRPGLPQTQRSTCLWRSPQGWDLKACATTPSLPAFIKAFLTTVSHKLEFQPALLQLALQVCEISE